MKTGIITKAREAKEKNEQASIEEQKRLAQIEASMNTIETTYNGVKIPAYCTVSPIATENSVEEGLVIIDINGNEWVWIEVPKEEMTEGLIFENDDDYVIVENDLKTYTNEYKNDDYADKWYDGNGKSFGDDGVDLTDKSGCGLTYIEYDELYKKMLKSVYQNGGFYIGRYEMGIKEDSFRNYMENNEGYNPIYQMPVIQKNKYVYNYITVEQGQILAAKLSLENKDASLIFGLQWDLVNIFIEKKGASLGENIQDRKEIILKNSTDFGNYKNSEYYVYNKEAEYSINNGQTFNLINTNFLKNSSFSVLFTTGATERNMLLNIYDLAGNVSEFTLEKQLNSENNTISTVRGGGYYDSGNNYAPINKRSSIQLKASNHGRGARVALY